MCLKCYLDVNEVPQLTLPLNIWFYTIHGNLTSVKECVFEHTGVTWGHVQSSDTAALRLLPPFSCQRTRLELYADVNNDYLNNWMRYPAPPLPNICSPSVRSCMFVNKCVFCSCTFTENRMSHWSRALLLSWWKDEIFFTHISVTLYSKPWCVMHYNGLLEGIMHYNFSQCALYYI